MTLQEREKSRTPPNKNLLMVNNPTRCGTSQIGNLGCAGKVTRDEKFKNRTRSWGKVDVALQKRAIEGRGTPSLLPKKSVGRPSDSASQRNRKARSRIQKEKGKISETQGREERQVSALWDKKGEEATQLAGSRYLGKKRGRDMSDYAEPRPLNVHLYLGTKGR